MLKKRRVRYIGSRTFYRGGKTWYEGVYDGKKDKKSLREVKVRSDEYFRLIKQDPRIAKYLALGDVVLKVKSHWYRFVDETSK